MKLTYLLICVVLGSTTTASAQRRGGSRAIDIQESTLELGEPGIAWYPKLEDGLAEAERRNRPILFMAVASQCNSIPGVF